MVHMDPHQLFRLYASSRDHKSIPRSLLVSTGPWFHMHIWLCDEMQVTMLGYRTSISSSWWLYEMMLLFRVSEIRSQNYL